MEENLESALILEDDVDWDVRLKPQLELIAEGSRSLLTSPDLEATRFSTPMAKAPFTSPYGPGWDLMWLGHCGEVFPEQLQELSKLLPPKDANTNSPTSRENHAGGAGRPRLAEALTQHAIYPIMDDPTVPPAANTTGLVDFAAHPPHTRWVHVSGAPICTFAYALSQQGARKVLLSLGVEDWHEPFDNAIAGMCRKAVGEWPEMIDEEEDEGNEDGARRRKKKTKAEIQDRSLDMRCLSVTPPVFFHHKAKGSVEADSDIRQVDADDKLGGGTVRDKGWTENIVWSARLNLRNMVLGRKIESQF